ncbi:MAG: metallophosphatase domain-containing protein [Burkholderiales bacterium]|nr:metallophosphatase domain-containing protein [Burkholderiales bacterium]
MKIVCISDTHSQYHILNDILPDADMIIHAGDLVRHGSVEEIQDFINWYSKLNYKYKIFIGGNHDGSLEHSKDQIHIPKNIIYLENTLIEIEGIKIWGSPVSPPYRSFGFMWDEKRREELYKTVPKCDILINHSPPLGTLDLIEEGRNVGCEYLALAIAKVKPKLVICGHIHESYGTIKKDGTIYINPSIMTKKYQPTNLPIIVDYQNVCLSNCS